MKEAPQAWVVRTPLPLGRLHELIIGKRPVMTMEN